LRQGDALGDVLLEAQRGGWITHEPGEQRHRRVECALGATPVAALEAQIKTCQCARSFRIDELEQARDPSIGSFAQPVEHRRYASL
jgi:hypothetical protein